MRYPTITAVTVTLGRLELVRQAHTCFARQTYPNKKLLIVTDGGEQEHGALKALAKSDRNVYVLHVAGRRRTLGELRNLSLEHSPSDLTIQWDDDDWYGPTRMMEQYHGLGDGRACLLTEQLHYFRPTNTVAWTVDPSGIEGTILFDRRVGLRYPSERRGEDTVLKRQLQARGELRFVPGGTCYCRTYHGGNTWDLKHHLKRVRNLGKKDISLEELKRAAAIYGWPSGWKPLRGG